MITLSWSPLLLFLVFSKVEQYVMYNDKLCGIRIFVAYLHPKSLF